LTDERSVAIGSGEPSKRRARKSFWFWPLLAVLVLADCGSKRLVVERLPVEHVPHEIFGDVLRFTLAYNEGIAFGIQFGSRWVYAAMAVAVLGLLWRLYRDTSAHDRWQAAALGLVCGGALGNLVDRIRWTRGVVDFIDVGAGGYRFWTFNIADMGVTIGAVMLAIGLLRAQPEESRPEGGAPIGGGSLLSR
jgi:signal peptidase II